MDAQACHCSHQNESVASSQEMIVPQNSKWADHTYILPAKLFWQCSLRDRANLSGLSRYEVENSDESPNHLPLSTENIQRFCRLYNLGFINASPQQIVSAGALFLGVIHAGVNLEDTFSLNITEEGEYICLASVVRHLVGRTLFLKIDNRRHPEYMRTRTDSMGWNEVCMSMIIQKAFGIDDIPAIIPDGVDEFDTLLSHFGFFHGLYFLPKQTCDPTGTQKMCEVEGWNKAIPYITGWSERQEHPEEEHWTICIGTKEKENQEQGFLVIGFRWKNLKVVFAPKLSLLGKTLTKYAMFYSVVEIAQAHLTCALDWFEDISRILDGRRFEGKGTEYTLKRTREEAEHRRLRESRRLSKTKKIN